MRSFIRLIVRSSVDLPQPDGPISAVIDASATSIDHVLHGPERAVVRSSRPGATMIARRRSRSSPSRRARRCRMRSDDTGRLTSRVGGGPARSAWSWCLRVGFVVSVGAVWVGSFIRHHRRSYRLRRMIANAFAMTVTSSKTMIAAEVRARNPPAACGPSRRRSPAGRCTAREEVLDPAGLSRTTRAPRR